MKKQRKPLGLKVDVDEAEKTFEISEDPNLIKQS